MMFNSDGAEISYSVRGGGRPLVLLHPFPASHRFWDECAHLLEDRYQLILPDLRAHGDSSPGTGPATMEKHAQDVARLCNALELRRAIFAGVSIGGYVLFEFWRHSRERVAGLVLANTRTGADSNEARLGREKSMAEVEQRGPAAFIENMLSKVLGETTRRTRLDRVDAARAMMSRMTVKGIVASLQGLASRPDSTATLATINVPTLVLAGEEDTLTPIAEAQLLHKEIRGSRLEVLPNAGHFAAFEQPEIAGRFLRTFADALP
jgi:3-oxoadipate enol-lactonase